MDRPAPSRRRARRSLRPAALVHARGAELSHAPEDPRRGRPRGVHRGSRRRRPVARARAGHGSLAGHDGAHRGSARECSSKARSTRTSRKPRARSHRPSIPAPQSTAASQDSAFALRSSPTGGSNDLKRLYLIAIGAARRTLDIASPYFIIDESSAWSLAQAAKRGVRIRVLVEGDLTDAKPVKYASRDTYDALLSQGIEHLRVPADDDACEGDGRRRRVEHVRIRELRQPVARTQRRNQRCRLRARAGERVSSTISMKIWSTPGG